MNNKISFTLTGRQLIYSLLILAFGIGSLMSVGQVFAQHADPTDPSCNGAGQTNAVNGLGHVTYNCGIWKVVYHNGQPYLQWSPRDVSAGNEGFPGTDEWYPNTPGTVLPDYPVMDNPAPRNLVTNEPLDVIITNGVISILPSDGNGSVTVVLPDSANQPTENTAKKGFRCKATGNGGYQMNDVSVNADNTGFFVEVDAATLDSWALLNGQSLNSVQSDYCGSLDPNAPAAVTITDPLVAASTSEGTTSVTVINVAGNSDNTQTLTLPTQAVANGVYDTQPSQTTLISINPAGNEVSGVAAGLDPAGSGNSENANGHEGQICVPKEHGTGCDWVTP